MHCIFCEDINEHIVMETEHFKVVLDIDPIQVGHLLILSKNHFMDIREIPNLILLELIELEKKIMDVFEANFAVDGVSVIQNNGTIMDEGTHFHVHLVPRYKGDEFWEHQVVREQPLSIERLTEVLMNSI